MWANEAAGATIDIKPGELIGRYCYEVWHQRNTHCIGCPVAKACKTGQAHSCEMTTPDGRIWLVRGYPVRDVKGIITGAVEITIEITERKQAEKSLQENEERLRRIIEGANAGYFYIDQEGRFQKVNQAWLRMHGYSDENEVVGKHFSLTQVEKDLPHAEKNVKQLLGGKSIPFAEFTRHCKDGSTCFHIFSANPVVQGGKIVGLEGFLIDTTEYKQAEQELKESEAKYSSLVEQAQDGVVIIQDGVFKFVNSAVAEISGYTVNELIGTPFINVIAPESKGLVSKRHKARMAGKRVPSFYEAKLIGKDGTEKDLELTARIIQYQGKPAAMAIARDITERKREEKIKSVLFNISEATSVRIINTTNFYIALYDEEEDLYTFPYYVDQYDDDFSPQPLKKSLTDYVRRTGKAFFADKQVHERLEKKGKIRLIGPDSSLWLGAPLKTAHGVIGVVVVQSYYDSSVYSQDDLDLLNFISGHIAIAIQRKQSEEALRESEEKFRSLAEQSPNMIFINKKGRIVYANKRCEDVMGFSRKEFYSPDFDFMTLHAAQSLEAIKSNFEKHLKGEEIEPFEITLVTKDGEQIEALLTTKLINYEGEMALLGIVTDITEHKKAQKALKKSEQLYRAVVEDQSELICRFLPDRTITFINEAYCRYFGKKPTELIGKSFLPLIFEEDRKKVEQKVNSLSRKKPVVNLEERIVMPKGSIRQLQWSNRAIFDDKNNIIEYQAVGRDITEQKEAEKRLQDSEIRFRRMAENIQSGLTIMENGKVIYLNKRATEIFGYPEEELIDLSGFDLAAPEEKERLSKIEEEAKQKGEFPQELEFWIVRKDGTKRCIHNRYSPSIKNGEIVGRYVVTTDITKRKLVEEALKAAAQQWMKTFDSISDSVSMLDEEGKILRCNKAMADYLNMPYTEIIDKSCCKLVHEASDFIEHCPYIRTKETQQRESSIFQIKDRWFNIVIDPLFSGEKKLIGAVHIMMDITEKTKMEEALKNYSESLEQMVEKRTAELREAQEKLVQSEKMAILGQIASGIAHDLRNPMGVIGNVAYYLDSKIGEDQPKLKKHISIINYQIKLSNQIITNLLNFARPIELRLRPFDILALVEEVLSGFELKGIKIIKKFPSALPYCEVDKEQIQQVFTNLITNASQAMPQGGKFTISVKEREGKLVIDFSDTGKGISPNDLQNIFKPFFTTKSKGIGLGLALCQRIIEQHSGSIKASSKSGKGSIFTIMLPVAKKSGYVKDS